MLKKITARIKTGETESATEGKKRFFGIIDQDEVDAIRDAEMHCPRCQEDEPDYESMSAAELDQLFWQTVDLDEYAYPLQDLITLEEEGFYAGPSYRKIGAPAEKFEPAHLEADKAMKQGKQILMTKSSHQPLATYKEVEFFAERGFTFAKDERGEMTLLFEGILTIVERRVCVSEVYASNGKVTEYNVEARFVVSLDVDGALYRHEVDVETFDSGSFLGQMSMGEVTLEKTSQAKRLFARFAKNLRRQRNYDSVLAFNSPGWKKYNHSRWYYVLPTGVVGAPELKVVVENNRTFGTDRQYAGNCIVADFLSMREIFIEHKENAVLMQYYLILALMKALLRENNMNPQFLLAIIGETNTKKTTIATLFFKLYEREGGPDIDFTATKVALEEATAANADAVTIFDDITPPNTRGTDTELKNKVEALTRTFGGNLPRKRSKVFCQINPGVSEFTPVMGQGVITGEVLPVTLKSSRARIVKLDFKAGDCDDRILSYHQQHMEILPYFAVDFIRFLSENQEWIFEDFRRCFEEARMENPNNLKIPRFREVYAMFVASVNTFGTYLASKATFFKDEIGRILSDDIFAIGSVMRANDIEANDRSDENLISACILDNLSAQKAGGGGGSPLDLIYEEGDFIVIYPLTVEKMVRKYFEQCGKIFPYTTSEFYKFLAEKKLIKFSTENGKKRHTQKFKAADGSERRFLKFYRDALRQNLE